MNTAQTLGERAATTLRPHIERRQEAAAAAATEQQRCEEQRVQMLRRKVDREITSLEQKILEAASRGEDNVVLLTLDPASGFSGPVNGFGVLLYGREGLTCPELQRLWDHVESQGLTPQITVRVVGAPPEILFFRAIIAAKGARQLIAP